MYIIISLYITLYHPLVHHIQPLRNSLTFSLQNCRLIVERELPRITYMTSKYIFFSFEIRYRLVVFWFNKQFMAWWFARYEDIFILEKSNYSQELPSRNMIFHRWKIVHISLTIMSYVYESICTLFSIIHNLLSFIITMFGWFHCIHASFLPSGENLGLE